MSGFVDDWSVACRGINAVNHTLAIVENFKRASGQRINYDKSKLVPSRRLSEAEIVACQARWPNLLVSYPERLLGLYLGFDASMADQFVQPLRKFEQALADYERRRSDMSINKPIHCRCRCMCHGANCCRCMFRGANCRCRQRHVAG